MGIFKKKQPAETVDVVALRNEVIELKDRLAAAEQAKVSLDDRLSSLAATTMVLSSATKNDTAELVDQIENLQARLATTTAVGTKVDELHQRVIDVEQRSVGEGHAGVTGADPRIGEQLTSLAARLEQIAELAAAPVAPDDELAARLDLLMSAADSVSTIDERVARLDARLAEQTALADELASLRQRLDDVSATAAMAVTAAKAASDAVDAAEAIEGPAPSADLDERFSTVTGQVDGRLEVLSGQVEERIAAISARIAATEAEARAAREQAARLEAQLEAQLETPDSITPEQVATQIAPQLDQLGTRLDARLAEQIGAVHERLTAAEHDALTAREQAADIDSLRGQIAEQALWAARMGSVDDRISEVQRRIDELDTQGAPQVALDELRQRIDEVMASIPTAPDTTDADRRIGELAERVALTAEAARVARDNAAAIDQRLAADTSVADNALALAEVRVAMTARLDELAARLAATEEENATLRAAAAELQQRLDDVAAAAPADEHLQGLVAASQASIDGRVDELWERIVTGEQQAEAVRAQAAALEEQLAGTAGRVDELAAMQPRIDELAGLAGRVDELSGLAGRVDGLAGRVEQLSSLEARVAELAALELRVDELGMRGVDVDRLQQRLDEVAATVPDTTGLQAELARFAIRVESSEIDAQAARDQAAHLDDRLQSVSTQLTNQLAELGREIDSLATTETTSAVEVDDAVIQSLRSGQVRLATEQARYEISFREDLALLAEQVRQLRGRS
jgi:regulator of replication initiation timing